MEGVKRQRVKLIRAANCCTYSYKVCVGRLYVP